MDAVGKPAGIRHVTTEYGEIVLNEETGAYWHLNESASRVLIVLERGGDQADAVDDLVEAYGISADRARADIEAISAQLRKLGAL